MTRLRIPEDLSVVGIDDSLVARILDPPLTTVAIPASSVGERGVRLLVDQLRGPRGFATASHCRCPIRSAYFADRIPPKRTISVANSAITRSGDNILGKIKRPAQTGDAVTG